MEDKNSSISDAHIFAGTGLFFAYAALMKLTMWFKTWIKLPDHQVMLLGILFIIGYSGFLIIKPKLLKYRIKKEKERQILEKADDSVFCGHTDKGVEVHIKTRQRGMHTQVIGTTNAGKTESVIIPWAIQDIMQGRGLILIDGKADSTLLNKLWAYTIKSGREKDFKLFSLSHIDESYQFNPLMGGTAEEITERVFNAFEFENPYYRSLQFEVFSQVMRMYEAKKEVPTFFKVHQVISNPHLLVSLARDIEDAELKQWTEYYRDLSSQDRSQRVSGLLSALSQFAFGKNACLFNTTKNGINLDEALEKNQIIYFQLPVLLSPFLGKAAGKMILQCLQSAVANRHRSKSKNQNFYSVFLDDFSEYLYPGFVSILNKSRSANIGVVFAHQALGDIKTLGEPIANSILTNANIKVFMRGNDPDSAEYFSKVVGTTTGIKHTERAKKGLFSTQHTGDVSSREVEEFIIHPNIFKQELGVGEAVMIIPHEGGSKTINIKFQKFDDLPIVQMEPVNKQN